MCVTLIPEAFSFNILPFLFGNLRHEALACANKKVKEVVRVGKFAKKE